MDTDCNTNVKWPKYHFMIFFLQQRHIKKSSSKAYINKKDLKIIFITYILQVYSQCNLKGKEAGRLKKYINVH